MHSTAAASGPVEGGRVREFYAEMERSVVNDVDLSDGAFRLLAALKLYGGKNGVAWPGQDTLARDLGKSDRQVRNLLTELVGKGHITAEYRLPERGQPGPGRRVYVLQHPPAPEPGGDYRQVITGNPLPVTGDYRKSVSDITGNPFPDYRKPVSTEVTKERTPEKEQDDAGVGPAAQLGLGDQPPVIQPVAAPTRTRAPPTPTPPWLLKRAAALVASLKDVGHPGKLRELLRAQWFRRPPAVTQERFLAIVAQAETESVAKADTPAAWFTRRLPALMLEEKEWPGGRPATVRSTFRDDRSPTEKATNPVRAWHQTYDPSDDSPEGGTAP